MDVIETDDNWNSTQLEAFALCTYPYTLTEEALSIPVSFAWWVEVFGAIFIGFTGIGLNVVTIFIVLGSKLSRNFFNWLLIILVIFDSNFLLVGILEAFRKHFGSNVLNYIFVNILHYYRSVILFCSEYMTILLALERYQALNNSFEWNRNSMNLSRTKYHLKRYVTTV